MWQWTTSPGGIQSDYVRFRQKIYAAAELLSIAVEAAVCLDLFAWQFRAANFCCLKVIIPFSPQLLLSLSSLWYTCRLRIIYFYYYTLWANVHSVVNQYHYFLWYLDKVAHLYAYLIQIQIHNQHVSCFSLYWIGGGGGGGGLFN